MTELPKRIWLQVHGDGSPEDSTLVSWGDVSWCQDKIFEHDVEYMQVAQVEDWRAGVLALADKYDNRLMRRPVALVAFLRELHDFVQGQPKP